MPRLHAEWAALACNASEPNAFGEFWFVDAGRRHLDPSADLQLLEVWNEDELIGVTLLCPERKYGRISVAHVQNWVHFHSFLGTPLVRAGQERAFWTATLRLLDRETWARNFLHFSGLVEGGPVHQGLIDAVRDLGRPCDIVFRSQRALLESDLSSAEYYECTVRKKKRKELKRLQNRLSELGEVELRTLSSASELAPWCDAFLDLELAGWKGKRGSALLCDAGTAAFFREVVAGAFAAGRLNFLRLDVSGKPIAMLVNFITPPGSFSFKTAIDEDYARFSPGVLIQLENLRIIDRPEVAWMDSCASPDHPMIDSLWAERRRLVRVTVPLAGPVSGSIFRICRTAERASAALRNVTSKPELQQRRADEDE